METKIKVAATILTIAAVLIGWGISWANQNARIRTNKVSIDNLSGRVENVSSQATESEKAIIRMETKIEYIIKGVDEIKSEIKRKDLR